MLYYWVRSGPLSCSRSPPFTLVLNEPINHLRLLTVLIMLALELLEQLFTVSASQAINYGDCRQAVTVTEPRRRRPSQAESRFPRENPQRASPELRLHPTDVAQAAASSWGQALQSKQEQLNKDLK